MSTKLRKPYAINAGSMSDIAFLLLIFFLVTTTIKEDKGLTARLPEWSEKLPPPLPVHERNIFSILVNAQNQLLVRGEPTNISELKNRTKDFIINPNADRSLAMRPQNAIVSLKNDRGTKYETYIAVYNELKAAYRELWEAEAKTKYGKNLYELLPLQQRSIKNAIPLVISEAEPTEYGEE